MWVYGGSTKDLNVQSFCNLPFGPFYTALLRFPHNAGFPAGYPYFAIDFVILPTNMLYDSIPKKSIHLGKPPNDTVDGKPKGVNL